MKRKLNGLLLDEAGISFYYSPPKESVDIVRDIQTIHDPSKSATVLRRERRETPGWLKLTAEAHGNACAIFKAHIGAFADTQKVSVWMPDLTIRDQAAGWSALQLYGELSKGGPIIDTLNFIDSPSDTYERSRPTYEETVQILDKSKEEQARTGRAVPEPTIELTFRADTMEGQVLPGARGEFVNAYRYSLPDALRHIQAGYDELYPGANTSEAVAGLVSSRNLEDFTGAWQSAVERYSDKPVLAARMLLESDIFCHRNV